MGSLREIHQLLRSYKKTLIRIEMVKNLRKLCNVMILYVMPKNKLCC